MKKILKANSILSGIFMATLSTFTGYLSTAQAVDNDPNMALPASAAAAASQPMQAAGPITIKTPSAPASAASAPRAAAAVPAASAASSAASSATAAAVPAAVPAATTVAAPAPKKVTATELTDEEFKSYSFAFKNIDGAGVDKTESPTVNGRWRKPLDIGGVQKFISNDQTQYLDFFGPYDDNSSDVVTYDKNKGEATLTSFKNKKPLSYTVINKRGEYTATPGFCKLLAFQTNSKDFSELAERAVTCKAFYDKTNFDDSTKAAMASTIQSHLESHRRNLAMLDNSVAKPMIDVVAKREQKTGVKAWAKDQSWIRSVTGAKPNSDPLKSAKPRTVLSANATAEEVEDRAVLFDLAEACGKLWKDGDAVTTPAAKAAPASGRKTKN